MSVGGGVADLSDLVKSASGLAGENTRALQGDDSVDLPIAGALSPSTDHQLLGQDFTELPTLHQRTVGVDVDRFRSLPICAVSRQLLPDANVKSPG
nr:hypothetical protein [Mycolicibacterium sarraceniae]